MRLKRGVCRRPWCCLLLPEQILLYQAAMFIAGTGPIISSGPS